MPFLQVVLGVILAVTVRLYNCVYLPKMPDNACLYSKRLKRLCTETSYVKSNFLPLARKLNSCTWYLFHELSSAICLLNLTSHFPKTRSFLPEGNVVLKRRQTKAFYTSRYKVKDSERQKPGLVFLPETVQWQFMFFCLSSLRRKQRPLLN